MPDKSFKLDSKQNAVLVPSLASVIKFVRISRQIQPQPAPTEHPEEA